MTRRIYSYARKLQSVYKTFFLSRMPYHLELGSDGHSFSGKAIVVNSKTGKHFSRSPIEMKKAKAQKRLLEQKEDEKPMRSDSSTGSNYSSR